MMARHVLSKGPGEGQTRLRGRDPRVLKRVSMGRREGAVTNHDIDNVKKRRLAKQL